MGVEAAPGELLEWAEAVMAGDADLPTGAWAYTVAHLAGQALELALQDLWKTAAPGLEDRPPRFQLLCLPAYIDDDLAGRASHVWWSLRNASHHHPYELAPTAVELRSWLSTVTELLEVAEGVAGNHQS